MVDYSKWDNIDVSDSEEEQEQEDLMAKWVPDRNFSKINVPEGVKKSTTTQNGVRVTRLNKPTSVTIGSTSASVAEKGDEKDENVEDIMAVDSSSKKEGSDEKEESETQHKETSKLNANAEFDKSKGSHFWQQKKQTEPTPKTREHRGEWRGGERRGGERRGGERRGGERRGGWRGRGRGGYRGGYRGRGRGGYRGRGRGGYRGRGRGRYNKKNKNKEKRPSEDREPKQTFIVNVEKPIPSTHNALVNLCPNGGVCNDIFGFEQTRYDVDFMVVAPAHSRAKDVEVEVKADEGFLMVKCGGGILVSGDLAYSVQRCPQDELEWEIKDLKDKDDKRIIVVTMYKVNPDGGFIWWDRVLKDHEKIDVTQIPARSSEKDQQMMKDAQEQWVEAEKQFEKKCKDRNWSYGY